MGMLKDLINIIFKDKDFDETDESSKLLKVIVEQTYKNEPCSGSLIVGDHCNGCRYQKDHQ